ncbi:MULTISPECIES: type III secretion system cytoplasmic ring protein SctQ [Pseudomonas]|uniref:type III secretion system cytoplasmic ring protein SctQ n=1 Tax=Pseudomonas TaxID=286 RepID=UPI00072FB0B5|nr:MULTISPECIES: type III secretion system cytoplasmic ring protein SctQ [Pseudomonas]KTC11849.1 type III secretion protein [Pseudomonas sp. ICMP 10191]MCK9717067.1 type III secretion system cytoplasmic ring protein SctQ [Pseudomonas syringae pv. syringae]MCK9735591.1 type III secretion system cytoplasmic ring protein SctQ [Pseudomonas syringae pv. syringae]MCK9760699.1 type III secretion system cytoplasmic ring protein SctQ [Pseudomonas syringae pv. syringae]
MTMYAGPIAADPSCREVLKARLAQFDSEALYLHNRLHRALKPWPVLLGGQAVQVLWASASGECRQPVRVAIALGEHRIELIIPLRLLELSGLGWQPGAAIETDADALLLEQAWLRLMEPLEGLLGESLRVVPCTPDQPHKGLQVAVEVRAGDQPAQALKIHFDAASAQRVSALLEQHCAVTRDPLQGLRLALSIEAGQAPLTHAELRSLLPGDVVMLDTLADAQVLLRLGRHCQTVVRRQGDTLVWQGALRPGSPAFSPYPFDRNDPMSEMSTDADLDASLDDLPLTLICQLGSMELTLAQLREMAPGSVLPFTSQAHDEVDLMVNGRRIGRGELVIIGDGLGVRLLGFSGS